MGDVSSYMMHKRHDSDRNLASARNAATRGHWFDCEVYTKAFLDAMESYFVIEESILFPAFEEETGGAIGLTRLMLLEHLRLRKLMETLSETSTNKDWIGFQTCASTLAATMRRYNLHEERYFYPMVEDLLADQCPALQADIADLTDDV